MHLKQRFFSIFRRRNSAQTQDLEQVYLPKEVSEQLLRNWVNRLKYFRFLKANGGFDNDIDEIILSLSYNGQNDLTNIFDDFHIIYNKHSIKPQQPILNQAYSSADFAKMPSLIQGTRWIEQPVWQTINSVKVSIWCTARTIRFTIVGPKELHWNITETEFVNAKKLEALFDKYAKRIIDPPEKTKRCICPKYHPEYWETG